MWSKTGAREAKYRESGARKNPSERFEGPEKHTGYKVCDPTGKKIGKVAELSTNEYGEPKSVRVWVDLFRLRSILLPTAFIQVDEKRRTVTLQ